MRTGSKRAFWILLLAPAGFSLTSFLVGQSSTDAGAGIGLVGLFVSAVASIYCGCWLAARFFKTTGSRMLAGLFLTLAIAVVNFLIICAGCIANVSFH